MNYNIILYYQFKVFEWCVLKKILEPRYGKLLVRSREFDSALLVPIYFYDESVRRECCDGTDYETFRLNVCRFRCMLLSLIYHLRDRQVSDRIILK